MIEQLIVRGVGAASYMWAGSFDVRPPGKVIGAIRRRTHAFSSRVRLLLSMILVSISAACGGGGDVGPQPERATSAVSGDAKHALSTAAALRSSTPGARELFGAKPTQDSVDLNGDGKADLLWYNAGTGGTVAWLMDGRNYIGGSVLPNDPNFKVVGTADLNGDGKSDLLWYNAATGQTVAWLMNGSTLVSGKLLLTDPNFKLIGAPDLNGDGKSDLLWYNAVTGQTYAWLMNGTDIAAGGLLLTDPNFKVIATPDLNGDGKTDLLWYNGATGMTYAWLMNGLAFIGNGELLTDPNFKVIATPDLNGDGKSDLLWYSAQSGETYAWLMNGLSNLGGKSLLKDPNFKIIATPDLNGDGKSDLLWYSAATGMTYSWLMNGTSFASGAELLTDANFKVISTSDLNGDGKADLLWYSEAASQNYAWLMNGNAILDSGNVLTDSNYKIVAANVAPVASAGVAHNVIAGTLATLDGSASSDANGDLLTYSWSLTSKPVGSAAALASPTSAKPTFTADLAGTYVASLTVNDGKVNSDQATTSVTALQAAASGTIVDLLTGLTWMRCALGQVWTGSSCSGDAATYVQSEIPGLTSGFVYANISNWRVPTVRELQTIVDLSRFNPSTDPTAFPDTPFTHFRTSTGGWTIGFGNTGTTQASSGAFLAVRLVASTTTLPIALMRLDRPTGDFADNLNGTVTHPVTGLMWQKCMKGQTFDVVSNTCTGIALEYLPSQVANEAFAGYTDWRVPTIEEWIHFTDYTKQRPAINDELFLGTPQLGYFFDFMSSSIVAFAPDQIWTFGIDFGDTQRGASNSGRYVRYVRTIAR